MFAKNEAKQKYMKSNAILLQVFKSALKSLILTSIHCKYII